MDSVAKALAELQGAIYTGCDLGTTEEDMTYLSSLTPYVLASIENPVGACVGRCDELADAMSSPRWSLQGVATPFSRYSHSGWHQC